MNFKLPTFKTYCILSAALLVNEVASYVGYRYTQLGNVLFALITIATVVLAWKRLEWGLAVVLAELFIGGKGYLYSVHLDGLTLSIRIALFCAIAVVWLLRYRAKTNWRAIPSMLQWSTLGLGAFIIWGILHGIIAHHGLQAVYFDANAYLFFLLLVVLLAPSIDWKRFGTTIIVIIAATATVLGLKSLVSLGMFAHFNVAGLAQYYRWIRNTGVGEIAYISGSSYRVFFQSQIYGMFALFILAPFVLPKQGISLRRKLWLFIPMTFGLSAVLISLSRSFWVGGALAVVAGVILGFIKYRWNVRQSVGIIGVSVLLFVVAYTLMSWSLNFPYPYNFSRGSNANKLIKERFTHFGGEAAASSRLQLLGPLTDAILKNPIFGSGFATTVTYQSNDPRQLQSPSKGMFTTDAFELGYLDIALKIGVLGLGAYLAVLWIILRRLWNVRTDTAFGALIAVVALMGVHLTTPYLNHPLGIGLLLIAFVVAFAPTPEPWRT